MKMMWLLLQEENLVVLEPRDEILDATISVVVQLSLVAWIGAMRKSLQDRVQASAHKNMYFEEG